MQRTKLDKFLPVPVTMEVVEAIMTMPGILLFCTATGLVPLCPRCLHDLTTCASNTFRVGEGIPVLAVLLMVADVHLWDTIDNALCDICNIQEPLLETSGAVYAIQEVDIVTIFDVGIFFVFPENVCQSPVAICIAE